MRVLITGAAGVVGSVLREHLPSEFVVTAVDRRPPRRSGILRLDLADARSARRAFRDVDGAVDLAGVADVDADWTVVWKNNIRATMNALAAARAAGVRRLVYASSNHVTGLYEREEPYASIVASNYEGLDPARIPLLTTSAPIRPDGAYALGKVFGEAAARYYAEAFGLSAICLRIGTVNVEDRPSESRHYATWLSHRDLVSLVSCALRAPEDVGFAVYYGVSANKWRFWDIAAGRDDIGFVPQDNAEEFRAR
jgi:nucleoside-diphosphate-sugar epimerase